MNCEGIINIFIIIKESEVIEYSLLIALEDWQGDLKESKFYIQE